MRMPPVTGPSSMVMRVAPWKRALARVTSPSSSPRSSGTIIFCAAKYGALNAPSAKVTASSTASDRCPDQWTIGITAIRGPRAPSQRIIVLRAPLWASSFPPGSPRQAIPARTAATTSVIRAADPVVR